MVRERQNGFVNGVFQRRIDRPFFVSEWDHAWPDEWRAESSIAYAAVTALQGWSGMAIHTYRYASYGPVDQISGGASTINGVTYRNHFDSFNDPAKFGLFYHAALIVRRADVRRAEKRCGGKGPLTNARRIGLAGMDAQRAARIGRARRTARCRRGAAG